MTALDNSAGSSSATHDEGTTHRPDSAGWRAVAGAYVALTKPRIIELLLVTTIPVMFLAQRGIPNLWLIVATLTGGYLSAGAANTFNMVYDRDIDAKMNRTKDRPLVTGIVSVRAAMLFGIALTIISTAWFVVFVNTLSALLSLLAIVLYSVGYTVLLKRHTTQNIIWGGIAGCMPTLIGWSAVTGTVEWPAVVLFLVVFWWTPPHYWPLSMAFKEEYALAEVPMLPVEKDPVHVGRQIALYTWAMVLTSFALIPLAPMGWVYTVVAVLSGAMFLIEAHRMLRVAHRTDKRSELKPMRLFHYSISYLTLLFLAVAIDPLVYFSIGF